MVLCMCTLHALCRTLLALVFAHIQQSTQPFRQIQFGIWGNCSWQSCQQASPLMALAASGSCGERCSADEVCQRCDWCLRRCSDPHPLKHIREATVFCPATLVYQIALAMTRATSLSNVEVHRQAKPEATLPRRAPRSRQCLICFQYIGEVWAPQTDTNEARSLFGVFVGGANTTRSL